MMGFKEWAAIICGGPFFVWCAVGLILYGPHFDRVTSAPAWFHILQIVALSLFVGVWTPLLICMKLCGYIARLWARMTR